MFNQPTRTARVAALHGMALAVTALHAAEGNAERGRIKATACLGCHAIPSYNNVYPTYNVPKVGGQHAEYLVAALTAYRTGLRTHQTMNNNAMALSEQDIADIAAFFSSAGH